MNPGYIYILQNPSFPNLLKIGKTNRNPTERAQELSSSSGVPTEFNVVFDVFMPDCDTGEKEVHEKLKKYRAASNREFFELTIDVAKEVTIEIAAKHIENEIVLLEKTIEEKVLQFRNKLENEIVEKREYLERIKPSLPTMSTQPNSNSSLKKQMHYEDLLIKAIKWGKEGVIKSLLEKNVTIPLNDKYGKPVREIAAAYGNEELYEKYLKVMNRQTRRPS